MTYKRDKLRVTVDLDENDHALLLAFEKTTEGRAIPTRRAIFLRALRYYRALVIALRNGYEIVLTDSEGHRQPLPPKLLELSSQIAPIREMPSFSASRIRPETVAALHLWTRGSHHDISPTYLSLAIELIQKIEESSALASPIYADTVMDLSICAAKSNSLRLILRDLLTQASTGFATFTEMIEAHQHPPFHEDFCGRTFLLREFRKATSCS